MKNILNFLALALLACTGVGHAAETTVNPQVTLRTNMGTMVIELDPAKAPNTVKNFLTYVDSGFYDGTIFHRVIDGFMIQGGGYTQDYAKKPTQAAIKNEANNGLKNTKGTVAMARTGDPHSATAQFFINVSDNSFLDHRAPNPQGWGYAVFGKVISGMDTVDKIRQTKTGPGGPFRSDAPQTQVIIEKASRVAK